MRSLYNIKQITECVLCISILFFLRELWFQWQPRKCVLGSEGDFEQAGAPWTRETETRSEAQTKGKFYLLTTLGRRNGRARERTPFSLLHLCHDHLET